MYIAFVLKDVSRKCICLFTWEVDISPIPAKDAEILANYEARNSWDIRNIGCMGNGQSLSCEVKLLPQELEIGMIWRVFSHGALGWGDEKTSPPISGIINSHETWFYLGVLQPGRGGQGSG